MSRKKQIEKKERIPQKDERGNNGNGKREPNPANGGKGGPQRNQTKADITLFSTPTVNLSGNPIRIMSQVLELTYPLYDNGLTESSLAKVINAITVDRGYVTNITPAVLRQVFEYSRNALANFIHIKKLSNCQHLTDYMGRDISKLFPSWSNDSREHVYNLTSDYPDSGGTVKTSYSSYQWTATFVSRLSNVYIPEHYLRQLEFWYGSIFENESQYGCDSYTHFRPSVATSDDDAFEKAFTTAVNLLDELFVDYPDLYVVLRQMGIPNVTSLEFETRRDPLGQTVNVVAGDFMDIQYAQGLMYPSIADIVTVALPQNGDLIQGFSYEATFPVDTLYSMVFTRNNVGDNGKYYTFFLTEDNDAVHAMLTLPPGQVNGNLIEAKFNRLARAFYYYSYAHNTKTSAGIRYFMKADKSGIDNIVVDPNDATNVFHLPSEWSHYVNILDTNNFFGVNYITYFERLMNSIIMVGTNNIIK